MILKNFGSGSIVKKRNNTLKRYTVFIFPKPFKDLSYKVETKYLMASSKRKARKAVKDLNPDWIILATVKGSRYE